MREDLEKELAALEACPDLAAFLAADGVKGVPQNATSCPLARHLKKKFPHATGVWVRSEWVTVQVGTGYQDAEFFKTALPDRLKKFVGDFDDGLYPALREEKKP